MPFLVFFMVFLCCTWKIGGGILQIKPTSTGLDHRYYLLILI